MTISFFHPRPKCFFLPSNNSLNSHRKEMTELKGCPCKENKIRQGRSISAMFTQDHLSFKTLRLQKNFKGARSRQCSYRCSSHRHLGSEEPRLICIQLSIKVRASGPAFAKTADLCRSRRHEYGRKQQPNLRAEPQLVLLRHMYAIIGIVRAFGTCHLRKSRIMLVSIGS